MPSPLPKSTTESPRWATIQALQRWETSKRFADDVLHETLAHHRFGPYDKAFITETFYGILRHRSALDFLIRCLRDSELDPITRLVLRLGFYQIFRMRIPYHAAVNETVNLAGRARGLVNALLRRSIREKEQLLDQLEGQPLSIRYSHPPFLIDRWVARFGEEETASLCEWDNTPAEIYARVNRLRVSPGEFHESLPDSLATSWNPALFKVRQVPHPAIAHGRCYIQDPSTLASVELLDPQPGETILDACAAPGGKAGYIAERMENRGRLHACDTSTARLERLGENLHRLGVLNASLHRIDWTQERDLFPEASFDRVLADVPCSNTGVIRRRVDVRWRLTPEDFIQMPERQLSIALALAPLVKPGGVLVYSTCSLEPEENDGLVEILTQRLPFLELIDTRRSIPQRDGMDGAFAALLRRRP